MMRVCQQQAEDHKSLLPYSIPAYRHSPVPPLRPSLRGTHWEAVMGPKYFRKIKVRTLNQLVLPRNPIPVPVLLNSTRSGGTAGAFLS